LYLHNLIRCLYWTYNNFRWPSGVKNNKVQRKWSHNIVSWFCNRDMILCSESCLTLAVKIASWREISSWFWQHQTCRSHRFFCNFPTWDPPWLHFSTVNSPKSSLINTLWLPYHYNTNSSLTYMIIHPFHLLILWITLFLSNFNLSTISLISTTITPSGNSSLSQQHLYPDIFTSPQ